MVCLIVRSTFRLHDNVVLARALADPLLSAVYLPIDTARVLSPGVCLPILRPYTAITAPRFALGTRTHKHAWGYHQYAFLLLAMRSFVHDLRAYLAKLGRSDVRVHACKGTTSALVALVANTHRCVYIDRVDDPAWLLTMRCSVRTELTPTVRCIGSRRRRSWTGMATLKRSHF